jgi:hypothetical protein
VSYSQQFLYFNSSPSRPRKPVGAYTKSKIPPPKKLTKPKGVYTKGTVRSSGTLTRKPTVSPIIPRKTTPRPTTSGNRPAASGGGGGGGVGGISLPPIVAQALSSSGLADLRRQATRDVGLELDPQINVRKFGITEATRQKNETVKELQRLLGLRTTETDQLYGALDLVLQNMANKQQAIYKGAQTSSNAAYDALAAKVGQNYGEAKSSTAAELARLNQSSAPATARLDQDQAAAASQAAQGKANASSTVDAIQAAASGEQSALRGAAAATRPMLIAQARAASDAEANKVRAEWRSTTNQLRFEYRQLEGSRRAKVEKLYNQYRAEAEQAAQDAAQVAFLNSIKAAELGISQGQLDVARANAETNRASSIARANQAAADLRARTAKEAAAKNAPKTGMDKAYAYLGTYKGRVPQAQLKQALEDVINGNSNDPGFGRGGATPGSPGQIPGYNPQYIDYYMRDADMAARQRGWSSAETNLLKNSIRYYLGK